ncbi:MAG: hypothetical protein HQK55_02100 [Deltaproteobacteria bacterium]|nr:hypothetical protein [Deltaproteobacteria bacterium]
MLTLEDLKTRPDIVSSIDWEMTPQQAFEAYQLKSINAWKYRSLPEVSLFVIYVFKGQARLVLVSRTLKDTREIAEIQVPEQLLRSCVTSQGGDNPARGQYPINESLRAWLKQELGL